jgi:hypothetical protein
MVATVVAGLKAAKRRAAVGSPAERKGWQAKRHG